MSQIMCAVYLHLLSRRKAVMLTLHHSHRGFVFLPDLGRIS